MTHDDHDLAAAYAADALDSDEQLAFEGHLRACPRCREEVRQYRETLAEMSVGLAVQPPPLTSPVNAGKPRRPLTWLAAAAAVVAVFGAGALVGRQTAPPVADTAIVAVASASDARAIPMDLMGTRATVVTSQKMGETALLASDVPIPPKHMCYQVWKVDEDGNKTSAGLVVPDENGRIAVVLDTGSQATSYVITMEPPGGSTAPTGEMVGQVDA